MEKESDEEKNIFRSCDWDNEWHDDAAGLSFSVEEEEEEEPI
jgi:hypothetical protein